MKTGKKGLSNLFDIMIYSMIVVITITLLQIYSVTHQSTNIEDLKSQLMDEYAQNTLIVLGYASSETAYDTIQTSAVEEVSDKDFDRIVQATLKAREYTYSLDNVLKNWSENMSAFKEDAAGFNSEFISELESVQGNISEIQAVLGETEDAVNSIPAQCSDLVDQMNVYSELLGGFNVTQNGPCNYVNNLSTGISGMAQNITSSLEYINNNLETAKDALKDLNASLEEDTYKALQSIQEARCVLREVNVKMDNYISYLQLGVRNDATLMDMVPSRADLKTKSITETVGEALFIEDRLAQTDPIRAVAAAGFRVATNYFNSTNTGNETLNETSCNKTKKTTCPECGECLDVIALNYDAGGDIVDDQVDLNDEYAVIKNNCGKSCKLKNWKIRDNASRRYTFKDITIHAGDTITLHSGDGTDTSSDVYWNSTYKPNPAIWNNDNDKLSLIYNNVVLMTYTYDKTGHNVDKYCGDTVTNTECNASDQSLNNTKNQIIQAAVLTLIREDYRRLAQISVKNNLKNMLTDQGYGYCYIAETCCSQITAGDCSLPYPLNAAKARQSFTAIGNETGNVTLTIWKMR